MILRIYREYLGEIQFIGLLREDGSFAYEDSYLTHPDAQPISHSLPLRFEPYEEYQALPYFKGLLPEGRSLSSLAARLGRSENDYIGLLSECGLDCVGDIIICPESYRAKREYRKISLDELKKAFSETSPESHARVFSSSRLS